MSREDMDKLRPETMRHILDLLKQHEDMGGADPTKPSWQQR
jgi:hypothetical protein